MNTNREPSDVINRDELVTRMMGSVPMAERMLKKFMDSAGTDCDAMESAARMGDGKELVSLAHRHKGTAQTMSTPRVATIASELERCGDNEQVSELLDLIGQLRIAHEEIRSVMQGEFAEAVD